MLYFQIFSFSFLPFYQFLCLLQKVHVPIYLVATLLLFTFFLDFRCSQCGKDSEASAKMEDFYELELNVKGLKTIDESLDDYLSVEELHGDNQYFCESCRTRVDATRSIKLRSLPEVLNFQLKRCVFLPKVLCHTCLSYYLALIE